MVNIGYNSDTIYSRVNQSISPPPPAAVVQPEGVRRDDSGRSIMSALTVDDDDIPSVVKVGDGVGEGDDNEYEEEVESFYIAADLWHVYESDGYPYYLRMSDNFSQWDDPRVAGVQDAEGEGADEGASHEVEKKDDGLVVDEDEEKDEYKQELRDSQKAEELLQQQQQQQQQQRKKEAEERRRIETMHEQEESLKSPTMTLSRRAGVGATFINTARAKSGSAPAAYVPNEPIHAGTRNAPLTVEGGASILQSPARDTNDDDFVEAKEELTSERKEDFEAETKVEEQKAWVQAKTTSSPESKIETPAMVADAKPARKKKPDLVVDTRPEKEVAERKVTPLLSREEVKSDPVLGKYGKMASVGVPVMNVLQKLKADGVAADKIDQFCVAFGATEIGKGGDESDDGSDEKEEEEEELPPALSKEELAKDADLAKYLKMTKMGIPPPAVAQKMRKENLESAKIVAFELTFGLRTPKKKSSRAGRKKGHSLKRKTTVKMQQIHLNTVSEDRLKGSLWAGGEDEDDLATGDIAKLEQAFGRQSSGGPKVGSAANKEKKTPTEVSLVDAKRAYNVSISLAQFRGAFKEDYDKLISAVVAFDEVNLDLEKVNNLRKLLPTEKELYSVTSWKGDVSKLGKCERFFLAAGKVDAVSSICEAFCVMLGFRESAEEIRSKLAVLGSACARIVESKNLGVLLKKVLAVGNLMNESIGRPKVAGIRLESLLKLSLTKGTDRKTTVIDLVVQMIAGEGGAGEAVFVNLSAELKGLEVAARVKSLKAVRKAADDLKGGLDVVERCKDKVGQKGVEFLKSAAGQVEVVESEMSGCEKKVNGLCSFFAEDASACEASEIIGVLIQFNR